MKTFLKLLSFGSLALMFAAAILVFNGSMTRELFMTLALVGTVVWFVTVPFWMKRKFHKSEAE